MHGWRRERVLCGSFCAPCATRGPSLIFPPCSGCAVARHVVKSSAAVRDTLELQATDLGLHALGTVPRKTEKHGVGQRDVPVTFGGVTFHPGDHLYADLDGVVVLRQ